MGCGVSRVDGMFLRRVHEMRNQPLLTDSTHSISHHENVLQAVKPEDPMEKDPQKACDRKNQGDVLNENTQRLREINGKCEKENEFEDEDESEDDERMIGHGNFPGSPSFRVYFKEEDDEHDDIGKSDAFKDKARSEDGISSKETKKVTSGRKRRSFRKALPKGLKMKSCYTSPRSTPENTHLLIDKTTNPSQN